MHRHPLRVNKSCSRSVLQQVISQRFEVKNQAKPERLTPLPFPGCTLKSLTSYEGDSNVAIHDLIMTQLNHDQASNKIMIRSRKAAALESPSDDVVFGG